MFEYLVDQGSENRKNPISLFVLQFHIRRVVKRQSFHRSERHETKSVRRIADPPKFSCFVALLGFYRRKLDLSNQPIHIA